MFYNKNFKLVRKILHINNYPIQFVKKVMDERIKSKFLSLTQISKVNYNNNYNTQEHENRIILPYVPEVFENIKRSYHRLKLT